MCCLFGIYDYGGSPSQKDKQKLVTQLSVACEVRGIDATGVAYNFGGHLRIYKRPLPAHFMRIRIPEDAKVITGHTRMTTQGNEMKNCNKRQQEEVPERTSGKSGKGIFRPAAQRSKRGTGKTGKEAHRG